MGVTKRKLARQGGFGHASHADQRRAIALHARDLGSGFQSRALCGCVDATCHHRDCRRAGSGQHLVSQFIAVGAGEVNVSHLAVAAIAIGVLATIGVINDLLGYRNDPGANVLRHASDGCDGHDIGRAGFTQGPDVGAVIDAMRRQHVTGTVSRQKKYRRTADLTDHQRPRGIAIRCAHNLAADDIHASQSCQSTATNYRQHKYVRLRAMG